MYFLQFKLLQIFIYLVLMFFIPPQFLFKFKFRSAQYLIKRLALYVLTKNHLIYFQTALFYHLDTNSLFNHLFYQIN
jgi:hypothetical protein